MNILSYTTARAHLAKTMEQICEDHTPVIITRANAKPVVMLSLEDYESLQETTFLLKSPESVARLADAIGEIEAFIAKKKTVGAKKRKK